MITILFNMFSNLKGLDLMAEQQGDRGVTASAVSWRQEKGD